MNKKCSPSELLDSPVSDFPDIPTTIIDGTIPSATLKSEMPLMSFTVLGVSDQGITKEDSEESDSDDISELQKPKTNDKVNGIFENIHSRRNKLNEIAERSEVLSKKLETKISTYLDNSKNLPAVGITVEVLDSLASLYKIESDTQERIIKSLEKEAELVKKFESDADHEEDVAYRHSELLKALEEMRSRQDNPISFRGENIG